MNRTEKDPEIDSHIILSVNFEKVAKVLQCINSIQCKYKPLPHIINKTLT